MIPAPKPLLMALARLGIYVEMDKSGTKLSVTGALDRLTPDLRNRIREQKPAIVEVLIERNAYRDELIDRLHRATKIIDAELLVGKTNDGYHTGALSLRNAQDIAQAVVEHTKGWAEGPIEPAGGITGPVQKKSDVCPACRKKTWWHDKYDVRHCYTCHPPAHASVVAKLEEAQ